MKSPRRWSEASRNRLTWGVSAVYIQCADMNMCIGYHETPQIQTSRQKIIGKEERSSFVRSTKDAGEPVLLNLGRRIRRQAKMRWTRLRKAYKNRLSSLDRGKGSLLQTLTKKHIKNLTRY